MPTKTKPKTSSSSKKTGPPSAKPQEVPAPLSKIHALAPIPLKTIPRVPRNFKSTPIQKRRSQLRFVPADLRAEVFLALEEIVAKGPEKIRGELGEQVEDTAGLPALIQAIKENDRAIVLAQSLLAYVTERGQFLDNEALNILDDVREEIEHRAKKKPALREEYPRTLAYYEAKAKKISEGIARSREEKAKDPEA
jgi:hypothetical protein